MGVRRWTSENPASPFLLVLCLLITQLCWSETSTDQLPVMSLVHDAKDLTEEAQHSLSLLLAWEIPLCFLPLCSPILLSLPTDEALCYTSAFRQLARKGWRSAQCLCNSALVYPDGFSVAEVIWMMNAFFLLGQNPFPGMHHLALSSQVISLSIWAAVSHFWCLLVFSWGWLQALRCGGGVREEEEGTPRSKSRRKYVSTPAIGVTGTYRMVPKVALILLPYVPPWTKPELCRYQMIEDWASKVGWSREQWRPSCCSLAAMHASPQLPSSFWPFCF